MKKVISFSLWGNIPTYTIGAIRNAECAAVFYPDFECWFYVHRETVPHEIIIQLSTYNNVKVILKDGNLNTCKPTMWRFESIDHPDVEINMSRDTDTRFLHRERMAVENWIHSGKLFHIMRDHPYHHNVIMAGMFGTRKIPNVIWCDIINKEEQIENKEYDQLFLQKYIYPIIKNNALIHASFHKYESHAIDFPIPYDREYRFVGEYVYHDESFSKEYNDLIKNELDI